MMGEPGSQSTNLPTQQKTIKFIPIDKVTRNHTLNHKLYNSLLLPWQKKKFH